MSSSWTLSTPIRSGGMVWDGGIDRLKRCRRSRRVSEGTVGRLEKRSIVSFRV